MAASRARVKFVFLAKGGVRGGAPARPPRAPGGPLHQVLQPGFGAARDFEGYDTVELIVHQDRVPDESRVLTARAARRALHRNALLRQRTLNHRGRSAL